MPRLPRKRFVFLAALSDGILGRIVPAIVGFGIGIAAVATGLIPFRIC